MQIEIIQDLFKFTGEDPMLSDQQQYRYMTVDDMKSLGDDSVKIDVTRDENDHHRDSFSKHIINNLYKHSQFPFYLFIQFKFNVKDIQIILQNFSYL